MHGNRGAYTRGCRCEACCAANTAWCAAAKLRRASNLEGKPHGVANTYRNYGCRCDQCSEAYRVYYREWRAQRRAAGLPVRHR